jgi:uncharacterized protein involved in outer membrane biogenesis
VLYTLGGFLLAPWLIERYVPRYAQEQLGRRATIENVRVNPFLLTLEATRFRLEGAGERPTLAFERLFADFELSGFFGSPWTFSLVRLESPSIALEIDAEGRFNIAELLERLRDPDTPDSEPPALRLEHVVVEDGRISFDDRSGKHPASAVVAPVSFELNDFVTRGEGRARYTLSARSEEAGALKASGTFAMQPFALEGELALREFRLAAAWQYFRDTLGVTEPQGSLTISGHYAIGGKEPGAIALTRVQGELADLRLALPESDAPLLALRTLRLEDGALTLPQREVAIGALHFSDGELGARVAQDGTFDWQRLVRSDGAEPTSPAATAAPDARPWQVHLRAGTIERVALVYSDRSRAPNLDVQAKALDAALGLRVTAGGGPTRVLVEDLNATLRGTALASPDVTPATLATLTVKGGRIDSAERYIGAAAVALTGANIDLARDASGPAGLMKALMQPGTDSAEAPGEGEPWRFELREVAFDEFALAYRDTGYAPPFAAAVQSFKGRLQLEARTGAGPAQVIATGIELAAEGARLATPGNETPFTTLGTFALTGGRIDTLERTAAASEIRMSGGSVEIVRGADGPRGLLRLVMPQASMQEAPAAPNAAGSQNAWSYQVGAVSLTEFDVKLRDESAPAPIRYDVRVASVALENLDSASKKPIALKADLRVAEKGTLAGIGTLGQDFSSANVEVKAAQLPLQPLHPLVAKHAALRLQSGTLSAVARVNYRKGAEPELTAQGRASVAGFQLDEEDSGERFIAWRRLVADGVKLALSPNALSVAEIRVVEPGMKLVIEKDRSVNLTSVLKKDPAVDPKPAPPAPQRTAAPTDASEDATTPLPFRIDRIRVENGTLDFADLSLVLPFATRVHELAGALVNVTSERDERAQLALGGRVAEYGEASAEGSLILRKPTEFLDIIARFENVQMPALSPYTATFAGRKIAAGKLWLTLEYKIVDTQLAGENRIVLDDFVLGERVEAPGALDLPLDLAVALLKDSEGKISLAVPVTGDVDNPQFDYGKLIRAAIGNAIGRIITAPFRALASLFGKGEDGETLRSIEFDAGSDRLAPPEREKLDQLAKALKARPQLKLVVRGPYDPQADAKRLSLERVRAQLASAMGLRLRPGEHPGPIAFGSADTQKALEALLEAADPNGVATLANRFKERTGRAPDRINPVLGVFGRPSKDVAFYEAMYERLVELDPLPESAVRVLAGSRVQTIVEALERDGIGRDRLQAGGITSVSADKDGSIEAAFALETM